jgi:quercetin dioxygenase-like cupin family protein
MTQPIHIRKSDTDLQSWPDKAQGDGRFRILVDAENGPSKGVVQSLSEFGGAEQEATHCHDLPETAHVISGHGDLTLAGKNLTLEPGDTVFIPAGLDHGWQASDEGLVILCSFPADRFDEVTYHWKDAA